MSYAATHLLKCFWHERGGATQRDVRSELGQRPDVRACHTAVKNVAKNCDVETGNFPLPLTNCERVEQRLCWMLVRAIAGVDDAGLHDSRQKMRRAARAVSNDDKIGVERFEIARRILQRLAFFER